MTKAERVRSIQNRMVAKILTVNDLCPDGEHKEAMRKTVKAAVYTGVEDILNALDYHQADEGTVLRGQYDQRKGL